MVGREARRMFVFSWQMLALKCFAFGSLFIVPWHTVLDLHVLKRAPNPVFGTVSCGPIDA